MGKPRTSQMANWLAQRVPQTAADVRTAVDALRAEKPVTTLEADAFMIDGLIDCLEATLLYHSGPPWDEEKQKRWQQLTGQYICSSRNLCDFLRGRLP